MHGLSWYEVVQTADNCWRFNYITSGSHAGGTTFFSVVEVEAGHKPLYEIGLWPLGGGDIILVGRYGPKELIGVLADKRAFLDLRNPKNLLEVKLVKAMLGPAS